MISKVSPLFHFQYKKPTLYSTFNVYSDYRSDF